MRYPGGKNGAGVYQQIINLIPPHRVYIEAFAGSAAIFRKKRLAESSIIIDKDASALEKIACSIAKADGGRSCIFINGDGMKFIREYSYAGDEFLYLDPPYLFSSRKDTETHIYNHEMTDYDHLMLLDRIIQLPCKVMISSYLNEIYAEMLEGWNLHTFTAQTRRGPATECLWFNYDHPKILHDTQYLGSTYRDRERIKKKAARWKLKFQALPELERQAILTAMLGDNSWQFSPKAAVLANTDGNDGVILPPKMTMRHGKTLKPSQSPQVVGIPAISGAWSGQPSAAKLSREGG